MEKKNTLLMPFFDASESFTNGFECGQVWEKVSSGECLERYLIHLENSKQIELICETFGVVAEISPADQEWGYLTVKSIAIS